MTLFRAPWPEPGTEIRPSEEVSSTSWNSLGPAWIRRLPGPYDCGSLATKYAISYTLALGILVKRTCFNLGGCCYQKNETNNV